MTQQRNPITTHFSIKSIIFVFIVSLFVFLVPLQSSTTRAASVKQIKENIKKKNEEIDALRKEMEEYQKRLNVVKKEKGSLQSTVNKLNSSYKKLENDLENTKNRISSTSQLIEQLEKDIVAHQEKIKKVQEEIRQSLRDINRSESRNLAEVVLSYDHIDEFWLEIEEQKDAQRSLRLKVAGIKKEKDDLIIKKRKEKARQVELASLTLELSDQQEAVRLSKLSKEELLKVTKNKESEYQKIIAQKKRQQKEFESALLVLESNLREAINPTLIDTKAELAWPVSHFRITQNFGYTSFAKSGAYGGNGHNGIDLAVPVGTPVKAPASGVIMGLGNTDLACRRASYGRWIMVKHDNGLTSMFGHLSGFKASAGQPVVKGQTIAYSGNTGYSTGPHLHFTVFASDGASIKTIKSRSCPGAILRIPAQSKKGAYLNPRTYLPAL